MNTKYLFLLIALLLTNPTSSIVSKVVLNAKATRYETQLTVPTEVPAPSEQITYPAKVQPPAEDHAHKTPKQPEDGKHHHFHFSRLTGGRRRNAFIIASKIIITIMHICLFIYCFMHVFH